MADARSRPLFALHELETALSAAGVGVWTWELASGRAAWSGEASRLLGLPPESFDGSFDDFHTRVHPEDQARVIEAVEHAIADENQAFEVELRIVLPGGQARTIRNRGRVVLDAAGTAIAMIGAAVDVTADVARRKLVRESEERYRRFTGLMSDYVYRLDMRTPGTPPTIVGASFERITGYLPEEIEGVGGWIAVMHPDDRGSVDELSEALRSGKPFVNEYRIITKHGEVRWLRDRALPILDEQTGQLIELMGGVQDVTETKQLAAQLAHAQKLEALARLAGAVAHDFNNLLTVMMGQTELVGASLREPSEREALAELRQSFDRAADLTASLLSFARRRPAVRRNVRVAEVTERARAMVARAVGERVRVILEDYSDDALVAIDRAQFETALLNLAINAREAMPAGGELRIVTRVTELRSPDPRRPPELVPGTYATIEVVDTGTGMPKDVLARVFEPFFTTKAGAGTGLGLSAVYGVVRRLDGTIAVDSTPGVGSSFTIYLPIAQGHPGDADTLRERYAIGGTEKIVLVEDEASVLRTLSRTLRELGYSVTAFASAEDALADRSALADCALLVSDVRLPGQSGIELAQLCRTEQPRMRILLISGYVEDGEQASAIESGTYAFMHKPLATEALARQIRELLD